MIVTFDTADGSFDYYTNEGWENQLTEWRDALELDIEDASELDAEEVVEYMYGNELFFEKVPQEMLK
jgi:hypothetical protein